MKFTNDLKEKINKLEIFKVEEYLVFNNWKQDSIIDNKAKIWHRSEPEFNEYEILLPLTKDLKDYQERIEELIIILSEFHNKNSIDIINQIDLKEYDNHIKPCKGCNQVPTVKCLKSRLETGNC